MTASTANMTLSPDGNQTVFDEWATEVVTAVYLYYTPLLVLLGCVGNALSTWVFFRSELRHLSTSLYLTALAASDSIFLLHLLPPWMSAAHVSSIFHRPFWCQMFTYCSYVTCCASAWLVMAFTVERCVAVLLPLRRIACTTAHSRGVVLAIVSFAVLLNLPVLRFAASRNGECSVDVDYEAHAARFNMVDTTLAFTLPMSVIVVLNGCITLNVCRLNRARRHLVTDLERGPPPPACSPRSQRRVTQMMVLVSSMFVVLNLPAYTIRVLAYGYGLNASDVGGRWTALQQISLMFFHTNFGINFILYCLSGQNFRRALMEALRCCRRRTPRAPTARSTEYHPARVHSVSSSYVSTTDVGGVTSAVLATRAAALGRCHENAPSLPNHPEDTIVTIEPEPSAPAAPPHRRTERFDNSGSPRPALGPGVASTNVEEVELISAQAAAPRLHTERFNKRWTFDNSGTPRPALGSGVASTNGEEVELSSAQAAAPRLHTERLIKCWTFDNSGTPRPALGSGVGSTNVEEVELTSAQAAAPRRRTERFIKRWTFDNSGTPRPALGPGIASTNVQEVDLTSAQAAAPRRYTGRFIKRWSFDNSSGTPRPALGPGVGSTDVEEVELTSAQAAAPRRLTERFIKRWSFDNSGTPRPALRTGVASTNVEEVELTTLGALGTKTTTTAYIHTTQF